MRPKLFILSERHSLIFSDTVLTAKLAGGGGQTTEWVYGVTQAGGNGIDSNDVVGKTRWPDASTGASSSSE